MQKIYFFHEERIYFLHSFLVKLFRQSYWLRNSTRTQFTKVLSSSIEYQILEVSMINQDTRWGQDEMVDIS